MTIYEIEYADRLPLLGLVPETKGRLSGRIIADFYHVAKSLEIPISFQDFQQEAVTKLRNYIPGEEDLTEQYHPTACNYQPCLMFDSELSFRDQVRSAWGIWDQFKNKHLQLYPYVVVVGNIASGKTSLASILAKYVDAYYQTELWQKNPYLAPFYASLADDKKPNIVLLQHQVQTTFADIKVQQGLRTMFLLPSGPVVQEVHFYQDNVYDLTHRQLGLGNANFHNIYNRDNQTRRKILPPYIRFPILVYSWASMPVLKQRLGERGREMEQLMPPGYLEKLQLNFLQWVLAMRQKGVPLMVVDSEKYDFSDSGNCGQIICEQIWRSVDKIHSQLVRFLKKV